MALDVMQDATYVGLKAAGHDPQFWSDCGPELVQRFYRELEVGDTSCARRPAGGWWVAGSFPTHARQAPPARQTDGAPVTKRLRRLVTVSAWTALDSVQHNLFVPGDSVALRSGTVDFEASDAGFHWTLARARFTRDVAVDGTLTDPGDGVLAGDLTVRAPGGRVFAVHLNAPLFTLDQSITITIDLGSRVATFTIPGH